MSCLLAGALAIALDHPGFTLRWTHSVERIEWREDWRIEGNQLRLTQAAVKGSGAGMEPGEGAIRRDGWYEWQPDLPPLPEIVLAASGATGGGWRICQDESCQIIGAASGEALHLRVCD